MNYSAQIAREGNLLTRPKPAGRKPRRPVNKVSERRGKELRQYRGVRKIYLEDHPFCEYPACHQLAVEIHHKKRRVGAMLNKTNHFMAVCSQHHRQIHHHVAEARVMGFL